MSENLHDTMPGSLPRAEPGQEERLFLRIALFSGILAAVLGMLGLAGLFLGTMAPAGPFASYKAISFSAALAWIFLGCVLAACAVRPLQGPARAVTALALAVIAIMAALELPQSILGKHFIIETFIMRSGDALTGHATAPISPAAAAIIIPSAIALFLAVLNARDPESRKRTRNVLSLAGTGIGLVSFVFVFSYLYGSPFLYETQVIPIAFVSAFAGLFVGLGIAASAGPDAFPARYFSGESTRARLLRVFVPLTLVIVFLHIMLDNTLLRMGIIPGAVVDASIIVLFSLLTSYVVARVSSSIGQAIDIAEQKQRAAEEERSHLASIVENSEDAIIGKSLDGTITSWNTGAVKIYGYTAEEMIGKSISVLVPPGKPDDTREIIRRVQRGERVWHDESERMRKDGTLVYVSRISSPIRDRRGTLTGVSTIARDITERRRAEEQVRLSEIRHRRLFESTRDGILILDRESGRIIDSNPFMESLTGYSHDELVGKAFEDIGAFSAAMTSGLTFTDLQEKEYIRYEDLPLETRDGRRIDVVFTSTTYSVGTGTVIQCNIRDISERKAVERQRETLIRELEQKNAELERFTYTVSHDLKSPLITIKGFLGLLEEDALKSDLPRLKSDISRITSATDKMQDLLSDLLTLSRIGRIVNPPERVAFGDIAREAVEQVGAAIRNRGVAVTIQENLPVVNVDRVRIREVLVNLIENGIKFMGDQANPAIAIGVRDESGRPVFFVQDNGIGIEPQYQKKIFGLFEKLNAKTEGTGVGLAIVKRIIEVHGGEIRVESAGPGTGSTFLFTLPVV